MPNCFEVLVSSIVFVMKESVIGVSVTENRHSPDWQAGRVSMRHCGVTPLCNLGNAFILFIYATSYGSLLRVS